MAGFAVRDSHERFAGNVFTVVTDEVEMPDGGYADRDYIVHVGSVGVVALDADGRVVLVRQYRHPLRHELWELPAGLLDKPGETPIAAAARELAEEADLVAGRWHKLVDLHTSPGCSTELIQLFLARDLAPVPDGARHIRTHEESHLLVRWFELDDAVAMALAGEITNAACVAGVLAAARARDQDWTPLRRAPAGTADG